jgi:hypothetical protein
MQPGAALQSLGERQEGARLVWRGTGTGAGAGAGIGKGMLRRRHSHACRAPAYPSKLKRACAGPALTCGTAQSCSAPRRQAASRRTRGRWSSKAAGPRSCESGRAGLVRSESAQLKQEGQVGGKSVINLTTRLSMSALFVSGAQIINLTTRLSMSALFVSGAQKLTKHAKASRACTLATHSASS